MAEKNSKNFFNSNSISIKSSLKPRTPFKCDSALYEVKIEICFRFGEIGLIAIRDDDVYTRFSAFFKVREGFFRTQIMNS